MQEAKDKTEDCLEAGGAKAILNYTLLLNMLVLLHMLLFAIVAILSYLLSLGLIIPGVLWNSSAYRRVSMLFAVIALLAHGVALQQRVFDISYGQNLSLLNVISCVSLIICTIMTVIASRNRGWFLLPIVYSFAIINLALATFLPGEFITHLEGSPTLLLHIGLALFAYATLIIAALYALQLAWVDYQLKNKCVRFSLYTPPLMGIERKMFHIIQVGVILLTFTLATGVLFLDNLLKWKNLHKMVLSLAAWIIYLILLWGHYYLGWRGRPVVWFTLLGAATLTLAYFGNRFVGGEL